jgi:predicted DNA-binding transcriptional regulator YafY
VLRLRRAETAARSARDRLPRAATGEPVRAAGAILARLTTAVAEGHPLEMSYVNLEGRASVRVVHPLLLSGGYLTAYDEESGERRTFAVSRISSLVELADPG